MAKYYKQVSELNEWRRQASESIADSSKMLDALANHFNSES